MLLGDDAAQMHDAVAHDHAEAERAPVVGLDRIDDTVTNVIVVGGRVRDLADSDLTQVKGGRNRPA
jgi:hypothetical protein